MTPGSGDGRATATARRVQRLLRTRGWDATVQTFHDLDALTAWAREADPDFSHLVSIGGDTTQSRAAVLSMRTGVPFLPLPTGFGNQFAGVFGYPDRAGEVLRLLEHGEVRRVDVGRVDDDVFLSSRSYGFLDQVQQAAEAWRPRNRMLRHLRYYAAARRFFFAPLPSVRVEVDGKLVAVDAVLVLVANVEAYRGFLPLTPTASPIDGMFDVFIIPRVSRAGLAWRLAKLALRARGRWRGVILYRGRNVTVTFDGQRDEIRSVRRALPLLVPPGAIEALRTRTVDDEPEIAVA